MRLALFVGGLEEQGRGRGKFILSGLGLQHILGLRGDSAGFPEKVAFSCLQDIGDIFWEEVILQLGVAGLLSPPPHSFAFPRSAQTTGTGVCRCTPRFLFL